MTNKPKLEMDAPEPADIGPPKPRQRFGVQRGRGRPQHARDEQRAFQVALYIGTGCSERAVAYRFGISVPTLHRHYAAEIEMGKEINELFWVGSLAAAARKGNVSAIMFALSRKFGWIERTHVTMADDGEDGIIFDSNKQPAGEEPEED